MTSMPIADRAHAIQPTQIREFRSLANPDSLDLGIGQPDLEVPGRVREAAVEAIESGRAPYSDNLGLPEAREAVGRHCCVSAERTMITCGVQEGLAVAILGIAEPGDEILVPDPGFPAYPNLVRAAGATPVPYPLDPARDFALAPDAVLERTSPDTEAIVLNSPSNPTGTLHRRGPVTETLRRLASRDVVWISDEIYEDYVYGDHEHVSPLDLDGVGPGVKLGALSKSMHVMGWRIGWLVAPREWVRDWKPLHQHLVTCAPTPAQRAAVAALADFDELFEPTLETFAVRRRLALERSRSIPGVEPVPAEGAFYLFLDVRSYTRGSGGSLELAERLLDEQNVVAIPGTGFGDGGAGFLRIAYTVESSELDEAFDRMEDFFEDANR